MLGAIIGDMVGAPYEFDRGNKTKDFPFWVRKSQFSDDTVMTVAVAQALMKADGAKNNEILLAVQESMRKWGRKYPYSGYGVLFSRWLHSADPKPYGSFGNGSAMRVSSVGFMYDTIERTRRVVALTAMVTHNHPEGIKGAEATASAIFPCYWTPFAARPRQISGCSFRTTALRTEPSGWSGKSALPTRGSHPAPNREKSWGLPATLFP